MVNQGFHCHVKLGKLSFVGHCLLLLVVVNIENRKEKQWPAFAELYMNLQKRCYTNVGGEKEKMDLPPEYESFPIRKLQTMTEKIC